MQNPSEIFGMWPPAQASDKIPDLTFNLRHNYALKFFAGFSSWPGFTGGTPTVRRPEGGDSALSGALSPMVIVAECPSCVRGTPPIIAADNQPPRRCSFAYNPNACFLSHQLNRARFRGAY